MKREYHAWHSPALDRRTEMLLFGHAGTPLLVFPTSHGRFFEYDDREMVAALAGQLENGLNQLFCVDAVNDESWYNYDVPPGHRILRHSQYEAYLLNEVLPFIRSLNQTDFLMATGCSFGAYHAASLAFRHPDLIRKIICLGGCYDIHQRVENIE